MTVPLPVVNPRRLIVGSAVTLLVLVGLACYRCCLLLRAAPPRSMATMDLLLRAEDLPSGWIVAEGPERAWTELAVPDSQGIIFQARDEPSITSWSLVYRYGSELGAIWQYWWVLGPRQIGNKQPQWTYVSPVADQSSFTCYTSRQTGATSCEWAARYAEYLVQFIAPLADERMSLKDMERAVRQIDDRLAQNLGR